MRKEFLLGLLPLDEVINTYFEVYMKALGDKKFKEVFTKVQTSEKILNLIGRLRREKLSLGDKGLISYLNSVPYFLISKAETVAAGSLITVVLYLEYSKNDTFQLPIDDLHKSIRKTIIQLEATKLNLGGKPTLFDRYFKEVEIRAGKHIEEYKKTGKVPKN
jgi:hypothetical protein